MCEYFIIKVYNPLDNDSFVGYFKEIDKIVDVFTEKDGTQVTNESIDVRLSEYPYLARKFETATEARVWVDKLSSKDCHYRKFGVQYMFETVLCRLNEEIVVWERKFPN